MKIVWINDEARFAGGAETYIYQTAQTLSEQYEVENILFYNVQNRIEPTFANVFSFVTVMTDIKKQLELIKPDLIYVHQLSDTNIFKELSELSIPVVGFIHDHKYFCLREHKYTAISNTTCTKAIGLGCYGCLGFINKSASFPYISLKTLSNIKNVQETLKKFDQIIVASDYMTEHLILHGFDKARLTKIPLFSRAFDKTLPPTSVQENEKRFLFVGQLIRGKGVDTLLEAFATTKDDTTLLDICGDGKQRAELEAQAQELGIAHRVKFHGKISQDALSDYYDTAYMVVIPSRAPETFNLVGLEAMKHAKAVIASDVGGIREWLKEGETGLSFTSNDSQSLAQALALAINDPESVKKMGEEGLKQYTQNFMPKQHCSQLYTLFNTIIKDNYAIS